MCGIAGQIDFGMPPLQAPEVVFARMLETMGRRGPDQSGVYRAGPATLLHARLAVVDIQGGRQPMQGRWGDESYTLVYNGELYNTAELRRRLEGLGHVFRTTSDTEVVLHAYMQWGAACVELFNGIFAFAIWEEGRARLFLARDRIGVKPLFFAEKSRGLLFASEIKTLLAHPSVDAAVDAEGVAELLLLGPGRTPGCGVFQGVREVKPGFCGYYTRDGLRLGQYWALTDAPHTDSFSQTVEQVRFLVLDAIERQLVSDVPVCTFLSGGLDSSIISAVADKKFAEAGKTLHTFSVSYKDQEKYFQASHFQPNSDEAFIRLMAGTLQGEHHWVILDTEELVQALFAAVEARDLPGMADVDASLLLFCREIKEHATVALSGECADEIFGGYPWYRDPEIRERDGFPWAQSTAWRKSFLHRDYRGVLEPERFVDSRWKATVARSDIFPGQSREERRMKEMVNLNFQWFMQTLLDRKDRMSMYSGLEVRVPFCDWRIAEYLYRVPWAYKDYEGKEKGLLRTAMEGLLPEAVLWRKKRPYPKTHNPTYLAMVAGMLRAVIADPAAPILQIADKGALERLLTSELATPWYGQLMTVPQTIAYMLQLNYWMEHYRVRLV